MIENIKARLTDLEAERAQLEADLAQAKIEARGAVSGAVLALIADAGYSPDEILPLLAPPAPKAKRTRASGTDTRHFPVYAMADDPAKTYSRGKLPGWLRSAMLRAGLDPDDRTDREFFRDHGMVRVA